MIYVQVLEKCEQGCELYLALIDLTENRDVLWDCLSMNVVNLSTYLVIAMYTVVHDLNKSSVKNIMRCVNNYLTMCEFL